EKDKVITLEPNELPNWVSFSCLDNRNYLKEAYYIFTTLKGPKKLSHIEGNDPPKDDIQFEAWDDEDSLIMTWLWNSMTLEISRNYMFYSFVCEIWENLIETYSMKKDFTVFYDIESKIFNSSQGTLSITEYYGTLNGLWIELDQYQGLKMCKADSIAYTRLIERGELLSKDKLPSLSKSEVTQQSIMLDKEKGPTKRSTSKGKPFAVVVENTVRHTKDTCYKLYGKEKVLERMGENKHSTQIWVNQTTFDKENVVEHPSILQLDQDI
ncbi:hypothetical protein CR513_10258, partial [Mucuna pruriens]